MRMLWESDVIRSWALLIALVALPLVWLILTAVASAR